MRVKPTDIQYTVVLAGVCMLSVEECIPVGGAVKL